MRHMTHRRLPGRGTKAGTLAGALLLGVALTGCDFLDPTNVENPLTTAEDLAQAAEPTRALLPGLRAQFARAVNGTLVLTEVVSDNYSIHGTGLNSEYDNPANIVPNIVNATAQSTGLYWNLQELRALTRFVLEEIAPEDATATSAQLAEIRYYQGMAQLLMAENFTAAPLELDGTPVAAGQILSQAIADLSEVASGGGDFGLRARAALARAWRLAGDATQATQQAQQALSADGSFAFLQAYDATSITNQAYVFTTQRALKEMQPLPRLDFLDPKYLSLAAGVPVAKAEEMHLILAEAALAAGDLGAARGHVADAVELARTRPVVNFNDNDQRQNADLTIRPRDAEIVVRADPESPFRGGLVLSRPGSVPVPTVSGTSLDADSVRALTGEEETWHAFHLARQEIHFLEGRRMSDLGIRLPMMLREIDANMNINAGDPGTQVLVPSYIPSGDQMDRFTPASPYNNDTEELLVTEVTIQVDMNRILARERVNAFN
jgi:hypothetical protein